MKLRLPLFYCFFLLLLAASCTQQPSSEETAEAAPPQKPNIIFILADDLGYGDLSTYGQTNFETPNLDRLAAEGMKFTQHYSGSTVCAPSRSVIMTGKHTGHTFIRGNKEVQPEGQYPLADSIRTLPEMLKEHGYVTGAFGKWGLGYPGSEGDPLKQGFDRFFGYNCQRLGHHYYPYYLWDNDQQLMLEANAAKQKGTYAPDLIHEKTLEFIDQHRDTSFFLFVPSIIPHAELVAPEAYMEQYRGKFDPEKVYEGYDDGPDYRQGPYESQAESHAAFAAMVNVLDDQVGEIMAKLEALGLAENTLLIFSSDNGPHQEGGADPEYFDSNGPLRGFKRDLYEGGIRVPTIAWWPGKIKSGSETAHVSAFWDLYPTFAEVAGIPVAGIPVAGLAVEKEVDGISMLPTLMGEEGQQEHEYLYWEFHERGGRVAVRKGDWKAVRYDVLENPDEPLELYNLAEDIGEENNVAAQHPEIVAEMETIIQQARTPSDIFAFSSSTYLGEK
jgi:arylsulfatase A-like enzyme